MRSSSQALSNLQQLFWFDISVSVQVGLEVGSLIETALTNGAPVRGLLKMKYFVDSQSSVLTETLPTVLALKWLLLRVNIPVIPKIAVSFSKSFLTR